MQPEQMPTANVEVEANPPENRGEITEEIIGKIFENPIELGCGKSACVYTVPGLDVCVKRSKEVVDIDHRPLNSIEMELSYQDEAVKLGIKSPLPIRSFQGEDSRSYLLMQTIKGFSLKDVVEGKETLPQSYDHAGFWKKVREMLKKMHAEGLYHRDFHEGNIMIEEETGEPVIIDYGHATTSFSEETDPYMKENFPRPGHVTYLLDDDKQADLMERRMSSYLTRLD